MADAENRDSGSVQPSQADNAQPNIPTTLLQAEAGTTGDIQFNIPIDSNDISRVEIVDLDLVIIGKNGERFVLPQAALQATISPEKSIAKFKGGISLPLADQVKKAGLVKPVEGGSYRIEATTIKPVPGVSDKLGFEFNAGREGDEIKAQEKVEQLAAKVEQISKSLQTATLSKSETPDGKGAGNGPGLGPGTGKTTAANAVATSSPGAPPNENTTKKILDYSYKVPEQPVQSKPMLVSTSAGKLSNLYFGDNQSTDFGEIEVRRMLAEKPFQVNVVANSKVEPADANATVQKISADLKIQWQPGASKMVLDWKNIEGGLPDGFRVNGKDIKDYPIDILPGETSIQRINLSWNALGDTQAENTTRKFKLLATFVDANGVTITTTEMQFSYGDFKTLAETSDVDTLYLFSRGMSYAINGTADADNIDAGAGHDSISGNAGDDTLFGGRGDDTLLGGLGQDVLDGGAGNDTVSYANFTDSTIRIIAILDDGGSENKENGGSGDSLSNIENIIGSSGNDKLVGNSQSNHIRGGDGDDTISGGDGGADTLDGGTGNNTLSYEQSSATQGVQIDLQSSIEKGKGGDAEDDVLVISSFKNVIGSKKNDRLTGNSSDNQLSGLNGDDTLEGKEGNDTLKGGTGDDTLIGGEGADAIDGDTGTNLVSYADSKAAVDIDFSRAEQTGGDAQGDKLSNIQNVIGSSNNDLIKGDNNQNKLEGGGGDDTLAGESGNDTLIGGSGNDTADFENSSNGVRVWLSDDDTQSGQATDGVNTDDLYSIENIKGSIKSDDLTGNAQANVIQGRAGDDVLNGKQGNDTLVGGVGADTLEGGEGADWLYGEDIGSTDQGNGNNTVTYANSESAVYVYLDKYLPNSSTLTNTNGGDANGDRLFNIQNLIGSRENDILSGNAFNNRLNGGEGDDTLFGGTDQGNDTFIGGAGKDTMIWMDKANENAQIRDIKLADIAQLNDKFQSIEVLDFQKDTSISKVYLTAQAVRDIADNGDESEITIKLSSSDSFEVGENEHYETNAKKDKLTFYTDSSKTTVSAVVHIDQISSQQPVDATLQQEASRNIFHADTYKMKNLKLDTTSKEITDIKPVSMLQEKPLLVNATSTDVTPLNPGDDSRVMMELALPGLPGANKVAFSLVAGNPLPAGFGFYDGTTYQTFDVNSKPSIELAADGSNVKRLKIFWNAVSDTDTAFSGYEFKLVVKFYKDNQEISMSSSRLTDPITFKFADYRKEIDVNSLGDDIKGNPILYLPARGISYSIRGTSGDDNIDGGAGHDSIRGFSGKDSIQGGMGDDTLQGGDGADTLDGGTGNNTANYDDSSIGVNIELASDTNNNTSKALNGTAANDVLRNINNLMGGTGNDQFKGNQFANSLVGAAGNDTLEGGKGADTLNGGDGNDTASYENAVSGVTVDLAQPNNNLGADAEDDVYINIENIKGSGYSDSITGDRNNNYLLGGFGDDTLEGGLGADTLDGGTVASNDVNNTASYANSLEDKSGGINGVKVNLEDASQNAGIYALGDTYQNIQHVVGTAFKDELYGDSQNNSLSGGSGDDLLSGGAGRDTLNGGTGTDTVSYASVALGSGIVVSLKTPASNTGDASGDTYVAIENLIGSRNNDSLEGDTGTNVIDGGGGDDVFYASGGGDTFRAAANTASSVSYEKINSNVTAYLSADKQSLNAGGATQDKYSNIVHLTGSVGYENKLYGDSKDNSLTGGSLNDTLVGGAGKDTLVGGGGTDLVSYEDADDGKGVNLNLITGGVSGNAEGDQYSSIENVDGTAYDDQITGNEIANYLRGLAGNDVLIGGGGSDTLDGGDGDDILKNSGSGNHSYTGGTGSNTVSYELVTKGNGVNADLAKTTGNSNGENGNEIFLQIQHLVGSKLNDRLSGDDEKNNLSGNDGNDYLDGRGGVDSLSGGQGDDTLIGGAGADTLEGGEGTDTASYDTSTQAVMIDLTGQNVSSTANDAFNDQFENIERILASQLGDTIIVGSKKTDYQYDGGTGVDTIDFQYSTAAVNVLLKQHTFGSSGGASGGFAQNARFQNIENIVGTNHNDTLGGDDGINSIQGGTGDDMVYVSLGSDTLRGEAGIDTINFSDISTAIDIKLSDTSLSFTAENKTNRLVYSGFENAVGSKYSDRITGDSSANLLSGDDGNDTFKGEGGADTLQGDAGDDYFYSGDTATSANTTINGGTGSDTVDYTSSRLDKKDIFVNLQTGSATSRDLAGVVLFTDKLDSVENVLFNSGNDTFTGSNQAGVNSSVEGGWGNDNLTGGVGNDLLYGDKADDSTSTDSTITYNDVLDGGAGDDSLFGGQGDDSLKSSAGQDVFNGGVGNDVLSYANVRLANLSDILKIDTVNSTKGSGIGTGEAAGDVIGIDIETIIGADNHDTIFYSVGHDNTTLLQANASRSNTVDYSLIALTDPIQRVDYAAFTGLQTSYSSFYIFSANLTSGAGTAKAVNDRYSGIKHINGSIYNDSLQGDINNNSLSGGEGNDFLLVTTGNDTLAGGNGIDLLSFDFIGGNQNMTLATGGTGTYTFGTNTVSYSGIEGLVGGAGDDSLTGNEGNNYLQGNNGRDTLSGGGGDDTLSGGNGADTLDGGAGFDVADYSAMLTLTADLSVTSRMLVDGDIVRNIEKVVGSFTRQNTFIGNSDSTSSIYNEVLVGGQAKDTFHGSLGADSYYGGAGADELNYQGGANGVNSRSSIRGIDMTVDSLYCDKDGNLLTTLNKFVIRGDGVPTYKSVITWKYKADLASMESPVSELSISNVSSTNLTPFQQGPIDKMYTKITGYSNTVTGVNSGTDDYAGDKFYNIEILRGTDYNDKVTMSAQSNWGFTFRSNNGRDSMYGGDGSDVLDFRKTSGGTNYGNALEGNTLVGGLGADSFILNEQDMWNTAGTTTRTFNVYGDKESGPADSPVFQIASARNGFYTPDSYVDEIQIYAWAGNPYTPAAVLGGAKTLDLMPFINQIHSVEKIDVSRDTVSSSVKLSSALIQGLADNGTNSKIILRLKNGTGGDTYAIQSESGVTVTQSTVNTSADISYQTVTFKSTVSGTPIVATAYIEYV